jgi:hypothetical protein
VFKKKDGIVTRTVAGETILVPVYGDLADIQKIFSVDPVAKFIWDLIDGNRSFTEILDCVTAEFDVQPETASKDLSEFLNTLLSTGLIQET